MLCLDQCKENYKRMKIKCSKNQKEFDHNFVFTVVFLSGVLKNIYIY